MDVDARFIERTADELDRLVETARSALRKLQRGDGHWVFELEADTTIPSEYILMLAYLGEEIPSALGERVGRYLRRAQGEHGGWPLFHDGDLDVSASVKAYYALRMIGDDPEAPHMIRARNAILERGGAAKANVFTRFTLALFEQVPWRAVPMMPVEIMLLPRWFPFHLSKVAYWSRVVIVPLLVLTALRPKAANPGRVGIDELFVTPPERERAYNTNPKGNAWGAAFLALDSILRVAEPLFPKWTRGIALKKAVDFFMPRLNGEEGLGAIFPAMVNVLFALKALGYADDHPAVTTARRAIDKLIVDKNGELYVQPCVSPIWDTGLTAHALMEAGEDVRESKALRRGLDWLAGKQVLDVRGDWADNLGGDAPRPGGWAFQYENGHYPDVDDTAVVAMALHRADPERHKEAIARAAEWILGMQARDGGWGAFDADNNHEFLNNIPFADHGALLDPSTADVSARCLGFLAQIGYDRGHPAVDKAIGYLLREQEEDGSWYGRWGANYVYGTWSVLNALNAVGMSHDEEPIRRAVAWLKKVQNADGGWGEGCQTYWEGREREPGPSTASQTSWAVLALMAVGEVESEAVRRGVAWLAAAPREGARWAEKLFTGIGFPRVFYLKYHGYAAYFPLWALSRYRSLMRRNDRHVAFGM